MRESVHQKVGSYYSKAGNDCGDDQDTTEDFDADPGMYITKAMVGGRCGHQYLGFIFGNLSWVT